MKHLGVDHGNKRIGISISDELGLFARPLLILEHVSRIVDAEAVAALAVEHMCDSIVVGLPMDSDGSIGHRARSVNRFIEILSEQINIPVIAWDESFSTRKAVQNSILRGEKQKKRKKAIDDQAAAIILQDYLDILHTRKMGGESENQT